MGKNVKLYTLLLFSFLFLQSCEKNEIESPIASENSNSGILQNTATPVVPNTAGAPIIPTIIHKISDFIGIDSASQEIATDPISPSDISQGDVSINSLNSEITSSDSELTLSTQKGNEKNLNSQTSNIPSSTQNNTPRTSSSSEALIVPSPVIIESSPVVEFADDTKQEIGETQKEITVQENIQEEKKIVPEDQGVVQKIVETVKEVVKKVVETVKKIVDTVVESVQNTTDSLIETISGDDTATGSTSTGGISETIFPPSNSGSFEPQNTNPIGNNTGTGTDSGTGSNNNAENPIGTEQNNTSGTGQNIPPTGENNNTGSVIPEKPIIDIPVIEAPVIDILPPTPGEMPIEEVVVQKDKNAGIAQFSQGNFSGLVKFPVTELTTSKGTPITLYQFQPGEGLKSPFILVGKIKSSFIYEGLFSVKVLNNQKENLKDWYATTFFSNDEGDAENGTLYFLIELVFDEGTFGNITNGYLRFTEDNTSLPVEERDYIDIPIIFE